MKMIANTWTQINTIATKYVAQNIGGVEIVVIASDTPPVGNDYQLILSPRDAVSSIIIEKIIWGKPIGNTDGYMGVIE